MRDTRETHPATLEDLTLYACGLLDGDNAASLEQHLESGCEICLSEIRRVRESFAAAAVGASRHEAPPAGLRARLLERIRPTAGAVQVWKDWTPPHPGHSALHVVRAGEGEWQPVRDGIYARQLYVDPEHDRVTLLIRMDPGARYVPHRHGGPEQCLVLEGDLHEDDLVFHAGDFQCAAGGSTHGVQWTENGCLLLIVSSLHDELLPAV